MSKIYLSLANFIVGQPVRWNIYSEDEQIVLKAGESITSEEHWKVLSAQKLHYKESDAIDAGKTAQGLLSVVRMINQANKMLRETLSTLKNDADEVVDEPADQAAGKDGL